MLGKKICGDYKTQSPCQVLPSRLAGLSDLASRSAMWGVDDPFAWSKITRNIAYCLFKNFGNVRP